MEVCGAWRAVDIQIYRRLKRDRHKEVWWKINKLIDTLTHDRRDKDIPV
jgi:hypothetical protein